MLVLTRKVGEAIYLQPSVISTEGYTEDEIKTIQRYITKTFGPDGIQVVVAASRFQEAKLAIHAPKDIKILREELVHAPATR